MLGRLFDGESCSRMDYLKQQDEDRRFEEEARRCELRRRRPGFEKLDELRYDKR
jgi:hypothetical protein